MELVALSALFGGFVALFRGRATLVASASAFVAFVVTLCGPLVGHHLAISMLTGLGAVIAVQCSYLALCFALEQFDSENAIPAIHIAIGEQLRSEIESREIFRPNLVGWWCDYKPPKKSSPRGDALTATIKQRSCQSGRTIGIRVRSSLHRNFAKFQ
jgi:hypothetical protein